MRGSTVRFSLLGLGAACVLALGSAAAHAGSSAAIKNGGTLTVGLADEPDALDPTVARTFAGRIAFAPMCQKLYDLRQNLNIVPQLPARVPQLSNDQLPY